MQIKYEHLPVIKMVFKYYFFFVSSLNPHRCVMREWKNKDFIESNLEIKSTQ